MIDPSLINPSPNNIIRPRIEPLAAAPYEPPLDPRPDLFLDHDLWNGLLHVAYQLDGENPAGVFWTLQGMRCYGASLAVAGGVAKIRAGEMDEDEYRRLREEWLLPRIEQLRPLLMDPTWARGN